MQEHQNKDGADTTSSLAHIRFDDVDRFNQDEVGELIDSSSSVSELVKQLEEQGIAIQRTIKPIRVRH